MPDRASTLKMLQSKDIQEKKRAAHAVLQERSDTIADLMAELQAWSSPDDATIVEVDSTPHLAMKLLGELRASEAAPLLIRYIKVRDAEFDPDNSDDLAPLDAHFPALRALIQIGEPSVPYLLEAIAFARDPLTVQLAVVGLMRIAGPEAARFHLGGSRERMRSLQGQGDHTKVTTALDLLDSPTVDSTLLPEAMVAPPKRRS